MIARYARKEMSNLWTQKVRFDFILQVEKAVANVQAQMQMIPQQAAQDIQNKSHFSIEGILKMEKTTQHDVTAFINTVAENIGDNGKYLHYGLTSSDVLDTALSLQIIQASQVLQKGITRLKEALKSQSQKHIASLCVGRTHGMHAGPTTFGYKLAGHLCEFQRHQKRLQQAIQQCCVCKLSGAVGTYATLPETIEIQVAKNLGLPPETIATQVVPRDRHAEVILAIALYAGGLERLAIELRHLQRTEIREISESFLPGQQGSSVMPHKKNPISGENLTGIARILRSYTLPVLENMALWHERDISHSSVERVIFPDAFILLDYALHRMAHTIENLSVYPQKMKENMDLSQGQIFSSHLLLTLIQKGLPRSQAYHLIQMLSHQMGKNENLKDVFLKNPQTKDILSQKELDKIFSHQKLLKDIQNRTQKIFEG